MIWLNTLLAVVLVSLLSLLGIVFFFLKEAWLKRLIFILISISVGSLFGDTFIHLLPESLENISGTQAASFVLLGLLIFFILENYISFFP